MDIWREVKSRVTIKEVLEYYGILPVRGKNIYRCFAHDDKKPSANIVKGCEVFHCFVCNKSWDIFNIVEHFEKFGRKDSLRFIDTKFGLGLYGQLTHKEKLELARMQKEREREKAEKLALERYEKWVCCEIIRNLRIWEQIEIDTHLTRGEYRSGNWELANLYFEALKEQERLNWLYNVICGLQQPECIYDHIYGFDKHELLKKLKRGDIQICGSK